MQGYVIENDDCKNVFAKLADKSVDAIITDPMYDSYLYPIGDAGPPFGGGTIGYGIWEKMRIVRIK
jgi:hypothetical protein